MSEFKKIRLLFLICILISHHSYSQNLNWLLGTWRGTANNVNNVQFVRTIIIDSVGGQNFSGTRINELKGNVHAKIITAISGYVDQQQVHVKTGNILYKKEPPRVGWTDCSSCIPEATISVDQERITITSIVSGCLPACNATSVYFKLLCDFDTTTQRYLVNRFANVSIANGFSPCTKKTPEQIAEEKKKQQQFEDSLNLAIQKEQQRLNESAAAAAVLAKKRQKEISDSISLAKKQQQRIQDSITVANNLAKQKEQQHIKDSAAAIAALAKKRQKEVSDSINLAKKLQQHIQDSIIVANNRAKQKEQQHLKDSAAAVAALAKQNVSIVIKDTAKTSTTKAFETRDNVLLETYHIATPDILIELFDNAQIDGDRVSVYHNNSLIVNNQMLDKTPITLHIHADTVNRMHEFVMIAENLGKIAPNTALMRITAGSKIYKLSVKTDLSTNAKIVFYYDGN